MSSELLANYCQQFAQCVRAENGQGVADLLRLSGPATAIALLRKAAASSAPVEIFFFFLCVFIFFLSQIPTLPGLSDAWDSVVGQHIEVVRALMRGNAAEVFACLEEELRAVIAAIRSEVFFFFSSFSLSFSYRI